MPDAKFLWLVVCHVLYALHALTRCRLRASSLHCSYRRTLNSTHAALFLFMHSPPDSVGEGIMFSGCRLSAPFFRSFVHPDISCYHDISIMAWAISMKLIVNIQQSLLMIALDFEGQRSKVKVIAGRWVAEGMHVGPSPSSSFPMHFLRRLSTVILKTFSYIVKQTNK